jgi:hypothetical protein
MPVTQAYDPDKVVIFVMNDSKEASANDVAMLSAKLASRFMLPKYTVLSGAFPEPMASDRASLEQLAQSAGADDVLVLDLKKFSAVVSADAETEAVNVSLTLSYLNKKTNMYGMLNGDQMTSKKPSPIHGQLREAIRLIDGMQMKLDSVFPK